VALIVNKLLLFLVALLKKDWQKGDFKQIKTNKNESL
jgi:hypothetical protein